jgi:fumarate hydratase class II
LDVHFVKAQFVPVKGIAKGIERTTNIRNALLELALGGTAVGTGINRRPEFPAKAIAYIASETNLPFYEARNHFIEDLQPDDVAAISV